MNCYGIRGPTLTWMRSWLIERTQQVVLEGSCSERSIVKSGAPQGTVLGPLCFLLYINDMGNDISNNLKVFADDTLLFDLVCNINDAISPQEDLNKLVLWAHTWQMEFDPSKCYVLRLHKTKNTTIYPYSMLDQTLKDVDHASYLGITLTETLNWNMHTNNIKKQSQQDPWFCKA